MKKKTKTKVLRHSIFMSMISLILCFSMLIGTTFAWFTDSVTSANNIIKSGNLDIELEYWNGQEWKDVKGQSDILTNTLWEPGVTEVAYLRVANAGSLALKYQLGINIVTETAGKNVAGEAFNLSNYIMFGVVENVNGETGAYANREAAVADVTGAKKLNAGFTKASTLYPVDSNANATVSKPSELYLALVVYMPTTVGNEANHDGKNIPKIDLGINVVATQVEADENGNIFEEDSFDNTYDKDAEYPITVNNVKAKDEKITLEAGEKIAVTVPEVAPEGDYSVDVSNRVVETDTTAGTTTVSYDIDLLCDGKKVAAEDDQGNPIAYTVEIYIGKGLDQNKKVIHNGTEITVWSYDETTGYITFTTSSFSPFSVIFKNDVIKAEEGETVTVEDIQTAINNAEDGSLILIDGKIDISGQITIPGKSINIVGKDGTVINMTDTRTNYNKIFYIYGNTEGKDVTVNISNLTLTAVVPCKSDIWVRTDGANCEKVNGDVTVNLDNVTCTSIITDNNYVEGDTVNLNITNSTVDRVVVEASANRTTNFNYDNCRFGIIKVSDFPGIVNINGVKATAGEIKCISTAKELLALSDAKLSGTYALISDIDMHGAEFSAMSAWYAAATFNGNGHTISNVKVVSGANDNGMEQASMFFVSTNGSLEVSDLTLKDITVATKNIDNGYASAVIGYCEGSAVLNNVDVVNANVTGSKSSGMLVGHLTPVGSLVASDCDVNGTISISDFEANGHYAGEYVGTIAGNTTLQDCTANVTRGGKLHTSNVGIIYGRKLSGNLIIDGATAVSTADELVAALEAKENVIFLNDIKIDPANMSNAYGATGINVKYGQTIDGNGYTFNIKGAGGTWDSGINTTGGIIKNITVTGSFRGIFINHTSDYSEKVVLENVTIGGDGTVYTISCDQGLYQGIEATNCTFNGWTSFAKTAGEAKFVNCNFGEGSGYKYCRPYSNTEFVDCTFCEGYAVDTTRATVTFTNCTGLN